MRVEVRRPEDDLMLHLHVYATHERLGERLHDDFRRNTVDDEFVKTSARLVNGGRLFAKISAPIWLMYTSQSVSCTACVGLKGYELTRHVSKVSSARLMLRPLAAAAASSAAI